MSLVWASKASVRVFRRRRGGNIRELADIKAAGAFLGLVGSFIVFLLSCITVAI